MEQSAPHAVFVYGTLKQGEIRARCWPHPPRQVEPATTQAALYDLGPYPALVEGSDLVLGELWHLLPQHLARTLQVLDQIECYGQDDVDLYLRRVVPCRTCDGHEYTAFTYFLADPSPLSPSQRVQPDSDGYCSWTGGA